MKTTTKHTLLSFNAKSFTFVVLAGVDVIGSGSCCSTCFCSTDCCFWTGAFGSGWGDFSTIVCGTAAGLVGFSLIVLSEILVEDGTRNWRGGASF